MGLRTPTILAMTAAILATSACSGSATTTTEVSVPPATTLQPTTSTPPATAAPTTPTTQPGEGMLLLPGFSELGPAWTETLVIPYGPEEELLGTAPGGENLELGPEYGAQGPDGTWWFLDAAKKRLAHYSETGEYIEAVPMKPEHLVNGEFFQFQLPRILDDGTLVASRLGGDEASTLLVLEGLDTRTVNVPAHFGAKIDDGVAMYGFGKENELLRVDPTTGSLEPVDWFRTRAGIPFRLEVRGDEMTIELPDADRPTIGLRFAYSGDPSIPAYGAVEASGAEDGTLFLYLFGGTDDYDIGGIGGFFSVSSEGDLSPLESTRDPWSPSDPGSPAHLGVRPGTSTPWLMFVDTDGVRVFTRG